MNSKNIQKKPNSKESKHFSAKDKKRREILQYIMQIYQRENRFVSKREIRRIFHLELYNYFKNLFDMYQQINIEVPLCYCPKDFARKKIIKFVRERVKQGKYPTYKKIEVELNISIRSYFRNMKDIYNHSEVSYLLYLDNLNNFAHKTYSKEKIDRNKKRIINLIKKETKKGFYPSRNSIQKLLNLKFDLYFPNIKAAYIAAGINYQRLCPIILGRNKETALTNIILILLKRLGYRIERVSIYDKQFKNKKEDIKILNKNQKPILVELKAFRKDYNVSKRELIQLKRYMDEQKIEKGLFITTSNKVNYQIKNIKVIDGNDLINILGKTGLIGYLDIIEWIQNAKVNSKNMVFQKELRKQKIIKYLQAYQDIPMKNKIEKELHVSFKTYFPGKTFQEIIKEIKNDSNNDSTLVYKVH